MNLFNRGEDLGEIEISSTGLTSDVKQYGSLKGLDEKPIFSGLIDGFIALRLGDQFSIREGDETKYIYVVKSWMNGNKTEIFFTY